jgi:hypothetical protein
LGYFTALLKFVSQQNLGGSVLSVRLDNWGREHQSQLKSYTNTTGDIVPSKKARGGKGLRIKLPQRVSNAVKSYIDFAQLAGWLTPISDVMAITRTGRILPTLNGLLSKDGEANPFVLKFYQRLFFAFELWRQDGDVISTVLGQLGSGPMPLKQLQKNFSIAFQEHISRRLKDSSSDIERAAMLKRHQDISEWRNPARYAEQFVPTRLNWLLDLGLTRIESGSERNWCLTAAGTRFRARLVNPSAFTDHWIERSFFKSVADCLVADTTQIISFDFRPAHEDILTSCLKHVLQAFRRRPIAKFSVPQITLSLSILLLAEKQLAVDRSDILALLSNPIPFDDNLVIETRLSARENEAYLILNPV